MVSTATATKWTAVIVGLLILFSIASALLPEAQSAGDGLSDTNLCNNNGCFYNATQATPCTASAGDQATACPQGTSSFPLSSLFSGTGVLFLIISAALVFLVLGSVYNKRR